MANKSLFNTVVAPEVKVNKKNLKVIKNEAGGAAFAFEDKHALAQYAVTGTFNNVFYATAETQLDKVKELVKKVDSAFIAKLAVYAAETGKMKDMSAYLLAVLHGRRESELLAKAFPRVITSFKMLTNFVQIVRSGVTGRRSFGTSTKNIIKNWLEDKTAKQIFNGSIGLSAPSVADVIKMVHPKAGTPDRDAIYAYITEARNWQEKFSYLPEDVQVFEALKKGETTLVPDVPFRALTNLKLSKSDWARIGLNMPWNTLRQNLNMLHRNGVFEDKGYLREIAAKLSNEREVLNSKVLPYQLFTTYQNTTDLPPELTNAIQDAAEHATRNVPSFGKDDSIVVAVDVSGSMGSPVTGHRGTVTTKTRCLHVAGLVASCVLRQNKYASIIRFDTGASVVSLNPRDSIVTNTAKIAAQLGGGTDVSMPFRLMNKEGFKPELVIVVSDNESWAGRRMGAVEEWLKLKARAPKAKLVNIDIQPYAHSQVPDNKDVLNIGGFSDGIWDTIAEFAKGKSKTDFVNRIESIAL